jgi:PilZ domain-containing protein
MGENEFRIQASALPVTADAVDTIGEPVSVTVLVPPSILIPVEMEAPRAAIGVSQVFALRYFMRDGARRAIVRCSEARPWPGMRDIIVGRLLAEPVPAPERIAPRRSIAVRLSGSVVQCVNLRPGTPVAIQVTDISESGVGFVSPAPFADGDRVMLDAPSSAGSVDAELEIVRRDPARPSRFGGRFADEADGRAFAAELTRSQRASVLASSRLEADGEAAVPSRGMVTRRDDWA